MEQSHIPTPSDRRVLQQLDEATEFLSGNFAKSDTFQRLRERGVAAVPLLVASEAKADWVKLELLSLIARDAGTPIDWSAATPGKLDEAWAVAEQWARTNGYIE